MSPIVEELLLLLEPYLKSFGIAELQALQAKFAAAGRPVLAEVVGAVIVAVQAVPAP
jgi:hypothetical protein